jgi:hypothetical protein
LFLPDRRIEQLAGEMGHRTHSSRAVLHFHLIRLRMGDELRQIVGGKILARDEYSRLLNGYSSRPNARFGS